jgi:serine/threonine protein kinase
MLGMHSMSRAECPWRRPLLAEKTSLFHLIEGLKRVNPYDSYTWERLEILASKSSEPVDIGQKERIVIQGLFADLVARVEREKTIRFVGLADSEAGSPGSSITCEVTRFLGYGNTGPVYAVVTGGKSYALKLYSAARVKGMMERHGKFGLAGILGDLDRKDRATGLTDLGMRVLSKKPQEIYGRAKRMVKVHEVGQDENHLYVLMDLLEVDPISRVDFSRPDIGPIDLATWAIDCCVALCQLHVEEARLHLNIRPEAFIRQTVKLGARVPKYSFFQYPKKFLRHADNPSSTTEFIMVDHLDNSVDIAEKSPMGLGTVGSWLYVPPEQVLQLLQTLKGGYATYVEQGLPVDDKVTIKLRRTQMDDAWALGLTLYQFLSGGKLPFGEPRNLADMVNSILLTRFDFSPIHPLLRDVLEAMLEKDPKKRFVRLLDGCPEKIRGRKVLAEAVLYKLEEIALNSGAATA